MCSYWEKVSFLTGRGKSVDAMFVYEVELFRLTEPVL